MQNLNFTFENERKFILDLLETGDTIISLHKIVELLTIRSMIFITKTHLQLKYTNFS